MRITSGKYKDVKLFCKTKIRPVMAKVREGIFNMLLHGNFPVTLQNAKILDLFCGSGVMTFEAFSRGAAYSLMLDIDTTSARINAKKLALNNLDIIRCDISREIITLNKKYDLIFIDPPYESQLLTPLLNDLAQRNLFSSHCLIIIELSKKEYLDISRYELLKEKVYGITSVLFLTIR